MNKPNKIITHHTGGTDAAPLADSSNATAQDIDSWHKLRWPGFTSKIFKNEKGQFYHIGYHYVIEKNGKVVQSRGHNEEGAHCIGQNSSSIGVCFSGNFDLTLPTKAQEEAWKALFKKINEQTGIPASSIYPHRKYASKTCHGRRIPDNHFAVVLGTTTEREPQLQEKLRSMHAQLIRIKSLLTGNRFGK